MKYSIGFILMCYLMLSSTRFARLDNESSHIEYGRSFDNFLTNST